MTQLIFKYGILLFLVLAAFKYLEFQFFARNLTIDIYLGIVALVFMLVGFFIAKYLQSNTRSIAQPDQKNVQLDQKKLAEFSQREQDVLQLLCHGYSNKEIAKSLEISPNTVKTHVSKLFHKLDVHNRTEALSEAKSLNIIT